MLLTTSPSPLTVAQPWIFDASLTPPVYTRPVVGSELFTHQSSTFGDGLGDVCMGANFTSSFDKGEVQKRARLALAKLRFFCPVIAATIESPKEGVSTTRWVYAPMQDESDCESWLDDTLSIQERGSALDAQEFIDSTLRTRLPVNSSGRRSVFQCYLLADDTGTYGLYFHGSHCILDGWPTLFALGLMFEWMAGDSLDTPGISLKFGAEYQNLALDPVSVTGGPREAWGTSGIELLAEATQRSTKATPVLALLPPSRDVYTNGPRVRFEHVFSPSETEKIVAVSKRNGLSLTQLLEAAHCLALAASNHELSLSPEIDFSAETTIVSLERDFVGHVNKKTHFISSFSVMPIRIAMREILDVDSTREQLILAASALKAEYARFLGNPCLSHLLVAQLALPPPRETAHSENKLPQVSATMLTNLGKVAARLPSEYVSQSGERVLHVRDMCFGHRITMPHVVLHSWTFEDSLHLQLQASDLWASDSDRAYLERFFDTVRRLVLEQLD